MKISVLIPTIEGRKEMFKELKTELLKQFTDLGLKINQDYEIVVDNDELKSIGEKRNTLMDSAKGKYIWFIDDDDMISGRAVKKVMEGVELGVDVVELRGVITWNGENPEEFVHSIRYKSYDKVNGVYIRPPNHLNPMKKELAVKHRFPLKSFGEDTDWAMLHCASNTFQTEYSISEVIYHYKYIPNK
jgi:glycosyltransferase involved in cell wall biosynthesis